MQKIQRVQNKRIELGIKKQKGLYAGPFELLSSGNREVVVENVDIIIPTYKPDEKFFQLIEMLQKQTIPVQHIIVMNTEQKYFDRLIFGSKFPDMGSKLIVKHLSKREFDHGRTRNLGVRYSDADTFVMMTDDAVPADEYLIESLLDGLSGENVAVSYARQLAYEGDSEAEKYTRNFNYPAKACIKTAEDIGRLGIKTYFCSNVCAAYKRDIFNELGGFIKRTIFNEDMIYAASAIKAGYGIAYVPQAKVYHSHHYGSREQFKRNFDLGVSQRDHPEVFADVPSESEGIRLVKKTIAHLRQEKMVGQIPGVAIQSAFKYLGYQAGKHYRILPDWLIMQFTSNKEYWLKRKV